MKYSILLLLTSNSVNSLNLETLKKVGTHDGHDHDKYRKEAGACMRLDGVFGKQIAEDYHSHTVKDHDECPGICLKDPKCFAFHYQVNTKQCHNFMRDDVHGIGKPASEECFVLEENARADRKKKEEDKANGKDGGDSDGDDKEKEGGDDKEKEGSDDKDKEGSDDSSKDGKDGKKKKSSGDKDGKKKKSSGDKDGSKKKSGKKYKAGEYKDEDMSGFTKAVMDQAEEDGDGNVKVKFVTSESIKDK